MAFAYGSNIPDYLFTLFGVPIPVREFMPFTHRRWRADYAWPDVKLSVELEGGVHRIKDKFSRDLEKYNAMVADGWRILRYKPGKVDFEQVLKAYRKRQ